MRGHFQRYLITGIITLIPFVVTWFVVEFVIRQLAKLGKPIVLKLTSLLEGPSPALADIMQGPIFQSILAIVIVLLLLYFLGILATQVVGRQLRLAFEALIARIPFVKEVYGILRRTIDAFEQQSGTARRVVLIDFPSPEMKSVGLLTRVMKDQHTGSELAAVFVPTTPNPTNGYLEIVPIDKVTPTDWTLDEAVTFLISGGYDGPDSAPFERGVDGPVDPTS